MYKLDNKHEVAASLQAILGSLHKRFVASLYSAHGVDVDKTLFSELERCTATEDMMDAFSVSGIVVDHGEVYRFDDKVAFRGFLLQVFDHLIDESASSCPEINVRQLKMDYLKLLNKGNPSSVGLVDSPPLTIDELDEFIAHIAEERLYSVAAAGRA